MTLAELKAFAEEDGKGPYQLRPLTPAIARAIYEDHLRILGSEMAKVELFDTFDVTGHLRVPSREEGNPFASAAAVQLRRERSVL